jgi:hypothetical protein
MTREHPTPDLLDHYLINDLSEPETAEIERHVFACDSCFSRVASRELEPMALAKACKMLSQLENDGTRVLTLSPLEPDSAPPFRPVTPSWTFQPQYAMIAATAVMAITTVASIQSIERKSTPAAIPIVTAPTIASVQPIEPADDDIASSTPEQTVRVPKRKARVQHPEYIVPARYTKPFLPPDGDVEAPEFVLTQAPPPAVYAARHLDAPAGIMRMPDAPKKRVKRSRKVLSALASPFKKIGGVFATLAVGGDDRPGI